MAAELLAVFRRQSGDTSTEKLKGSRILHATMTSLLTWALVHFTLDPEGVASNVAVAAGGAAVAVPFWRR